MCQKDLRWKVVVLGRIEAFRENECTKGATVVKTAFVENQCAEGTFGENWAVKVKTVLLWKMNVPKGLKVEIRSFG